MPLRIQRATEKHREALAALHTLTFPLDEHEDYASGWWWVVLDAGSPVGFAGSRSAFSEHNSVYFSRCGVLPSHRGQGLQRRLLDVRLRHARFLDADAVITTTFNNPPSGNNLIRAGFRLYDPETPWGSLGTCYWRRDFKH